MHAQSWKIQYWSLAIRVTVNVLGTIIICQCHLLHVKVLVHQDGSERLPEDAVRKYLLTASEGWHVVYKGVDPSSSTGLPFRIMTLPCWLTGRFGMTPADPASQV